MLNFMEARDKWDRTAVGQAQGEFAERCLDLGKKYPDMRSRSHCTELKAKLRITSYFRIQPLRAATNQKQWYVTISRGRKGIAIVTADKQELRENVYRSGNRELAM